MKRHQHQEMSLSKFMASLPIPRHYRRYLIIQLLCVGFVLYLWVSINGGFIPKFLKHKISYFDVESDVSPLLYFGDINNDASKIRWSGKVNSLNQLNQAMESDAHMLEGDVILRGQGTKHQKLIPVMSSPPNTDSKTTLDDWLDVVKSKQKGIKLVFTSIEAVEISLQKLKIIKEQGFLKFPVWIHADVLKGPEGKTPNIDSTRFLRHLKRVFPKCTISLGWTVSPHTDTSQGGYSWDMVLDMFKLIQTWEINDQQVIFNADLPWLRNSVPQLKWLCDNVFHSSLMVSKSSQSIGIKEDVLYAAYRFPPHSLYFDVKDDHLEAVISKYRHFSRDQVSPLVLQRDLVMFHPKAWVKMGFHMEKNSVLGSTEAIILSSPIVYIVSKSSYKPSPELSLQGRVLFLNHNNKEMESGKTGLNIYLRSTSYTHFEEITGIRCFLGVDGTIEVSGSHLNKKDSFKSESQRITPSSSHCFRFAIIDSLSEIIFRVNVVHSCNTLESVKADAEIHAELKVPVPAHLGNGQHPYILKVADNKRYAVIDELSVKHS
ncbi:hypothetical protein SNE40_023091 [Patella caerulea]|uniref:Uncharacterized protein n=2 Tax=Patella caerulea TaxID=87958 RepID=A0AAN8IWK8_PATCE